MEVTLKCEKLMNIYERGVTCFLTDLVVVSSVLRGNVVAVRCRCRETRVRNPPTSHESRGPLPATSSSSHLNKQTEQVYGLMPFV